MGSGGACWQNNDSDEVIFLLKKLTYEKSFVYLRPKEQSKMGQKIFLDLIYQSMQDSAQQVRRSLGRPSSRATRQQALRQVAMLKAAKEAQQTGK